MARHRKLPRTLRTGQISQTDSSRVRSSAQVTSLMAGRLLATMTTSEPMRSSSRASGIMPSTTSAPAWRHAAQGLFIPGRQAASSMFAANDAAWAMMPFQGYAQLLTTSRPQWGNNDRAAMRIHLGMLSSSKGNTAEARSLRLS